MNEILFLIVFFLAFVLQTITGFAGTVMAMPPAMLLLGMDNAKVVLNVMAGLSGLCIAAQNYKHINVKELLKMSGFMFLGVFAGLKIYQVLTVDSLLIIYGVIVVGIGLKNLFYQKKIKLNTLGSILILLVAGIIHGMFVSGGALLVIYAVNVLEDKDEFRATVSPIWVILNTYMLFSYTQSGMVNTYNLKIIGMSMIPLIIALVIGNYLQKKINQKIFLKLTYILLVVSGLSILV
ncbi:MAG: sulfite exporter TauE/SafE family protein [Eubacteriales bacterium]